MKLEVLSHQHDVRDGDLLMVEVCGRSLADHDHLEMRIRQTNLGSPHLPSRRVQVSHSRFEFLVHVAGMVEQRQKVTFHDQVRTLSLFFPGNRRRFGGPCRISGCTEFGISLPYSDSSEELWKPLQCQCEVVLEVSLPSLKEVLDFLWGSSRSVCRLALPGASRCS